MLHRYFQEIDFHAFHSRYRPMATKAHALIEAEQDTKKRLWPNCLSNVSTTSYDEETVNSFIDGFAEPK
jgi:hypothetical protein